MGYNSRFFCNKDCEYYPCHKIEEGQDFNCIFCYCPLYLKEKCSGNPSFIIGRDGSRIKDCSNCIFPHVPSNYDKIIQELMCNEIEVNIKCEELYAQAHRYVMLGSGYENVDEETAQIQKSTSRSVYSSFFKDKSVTISLKKIDRDCIHNGYFQFGKERIDCQVLERLSHGIIKGGYIYICHAPDIDQTGTILEQYYIEAWQNSFLDCIRDFLHDYLERRESVRERSYVSDSFGPGFYGMPVDAVKTLAGLMNGNKAGVKLTESGTLSPAKSLVGIYLVMSEDTDWQIRDCISCVGSSMGCKFCYGYKRG